MISKFKTALQYGAILAIGLGFGYAFSHYKEFFATPYKEGNYAAHFADPSTQVVMYGTETCPYCKQARDYFEAKNIAYRDIVIGKHASEKDAQNFAELKSEGVPAIIIGSRLITGFNPAAIEEALQIAVGKKNN